MQQLGMFFDDGFDTDMPELYSGAYSFDAKPVKPVMIVACSKLKLKGDYRPAHELYLGGQFSLMRNHNIYKDFNVLIMSAKYGLVGSEECIPYYDMTIDEVSESEYLERHGKWMSKKLRQASKDQPVYVFLPKKYRTVFEAFLASPDGRKVMDELSSLYICYHHRGNGEQKERMLFALDAVREPHKRREGVVYRSGTANNLDEITGYRMAGVPIGTSLFHLEGKDKELEYVVKAAYQQRVFVDNGFLQNPDLKPDEVFEGYEAFVEKVRLIVRSLSEESDVYHCDETRVLENFTFVLPDNPFDVDDAQRCIIESRFRIAALAYQGVEWIMPMHKNQSGEENMRERLKELYDKFDNPQWLRVGIPTLDTDDRPFALPLDLVESMLSLKGDLGFLVKKIHFLGQGITNRTKVAKGRVQLAKLYNVDYSMDAARTRPTFQSDVTKLKTPAILHQADMSRLEEVIGSLKQAEFDEPAILESWRNLMYEEGANAMCDKWNAHCGSFNQIDISDEDCALFDEALEPYLASGEYVDVWVSLNRDEYLRENGIKAFTGVERRREVLAAIHSVGFTGTRQDFKELGLIQS
ncbi:DUF6884 domain-containing protein [Vibrio mediterranei]|uniref:DUF6884 domain-containing protein n=1 Tax=Vibrio mediterranei TaxID=689 RepID=UPI0040689B5D